MSFEDTTPTPNTAPNAADTVLGATHRRMVAHIRRRHLEASQKPGDYVRSAPTTIPSFSDTQVYMLTRDGTRPFRDEPKPYYLVYQSPNEAQLAWFDYIDDNAVVERREVTAVYIGSDALDEFDRDLVGLLGESITRSPTGYATDREDINPSEMPPLTEYEALRLHEERLERWQITSFSNAEASAA